MLKGIEDLIAMLPRLYVPPWRQEGATGEYTPFDESFDSAGRPTGLPPDIDPEWVITDDCGKYARYHHLMWDSAKRKKDRRKRRKKAGLPIEDQDDDEEEKKEERESGVPSSSSSSFSSSFSHSDECKYEKGLPPHVFQMFPPYVSSNGTFDFKGHLYQFPEISELENMHLLLHSAKQVCQQYM